jgi:hypothetical protein
MCARVRGWGGGSGTTGPAATRHTARAPRLTPTGPATVVHGGPFAGPGRDRRSTAGPNPRPRTKATSGQRWIRTPAARVLDTVNSVLGFGRGPGLVVLLVLSVLGTVPIIWSTPGSAAAGSVPSGIPDAGMSDPGMSPLAVVTQRAGSHLATGSGELAGLADIAVWVQPDTRGALSGSGRARGAISGLTAIASPLPVSGPTSVSGMLTRVLAVAAQLAGGLGMPEWSGARIGPRRSEASAGLTVWASLTLAAVALMTLMCTGFGDGRHRCGTGLVSVLERPG